jgi:hypothetical protein
MQQFYYILLSFFHKKYFTLWIMAQRLENNVVIQDKAILVMTVLDKENSNFWFTHTSSYHITPTSSKITRGYLSYYFLCYKPFP